MTRPMLVHFMVAAPSKECGLQFVQIYQMMISRFIFPKTRKLASGLFAGWGTFGNEGNNSNKSHALNPTAEEGFLPISAAFADRSPDLNAQLGPQQTIVFSASSVSSLVCHLS